MRKSMVVRLALAGALVFGLLAAGPAMSATGPGTIRVTSPRPTSILADEVVITWSYTYGTVITSSSIVAISSSADGGRTWRALATWLPLRGAFVWDTSTLPSGTYRLRVWGRGTPVVSYSTPLFIDHTPPTVAITSPTESSVAGLTATNGLTDTIVTGPTTLEASAADAHTGVRDVIWMLDGAVIGHGATFTYNFDQNHGYHDLSVIAIDRVGLMAVSEMRVLAVPGAIGGLQNLGVLPSQPISETPSPEPTPSSEPEPSPSPSESPAPGLPPVGLPTEGVMP